MKKTRWWCWLFHKWTYEDGEGPWEVYRCDDCKKQRIISLHY